MPVWNSSFEINMLGWGLLFNSRIILLENTWLSKETCYWVLFILPLTYFAAEQKPQCAAAQRRPQMSFRQGATTAGTCTGNCITWRRNWVCWDLPDFQTKTNTSEQCGRSREWRVSLSTTCPRRAWRATASMAAPVRRRASTGIPSRREDCRGGLCLSAGPWWSPPAVCQGTSLWCTGWPMGKSAPSAGSSLCWCPSLRVSSSRNLWRWVQWLDTRLSTELPHNTHTHTRIYEIEFWWFNNQFSRCTDSIK